jgi:hypothetical protein
VQQAKPDLTSSTYWNQTSIVSNYGLPFVNRSRRINSRNAALATVHLDLDDLSTYAAALQGVQRLFMVTGYTVEMMNQGKNLTDAAKGQGG